MLLVLYCVLIVINVLCLLLHKSSKLICIISIVFLIILMAGNTYNYDYAGYENVFNGIKDIHFQSEYGLNFLILIGGLFGLSFQEFLFFIFTSCLLLIIYVGKKANADIHFVCTIYLIFGYIADTVVWRNFIAISFLTCALFCIVKKKRFEGFIFMMLALLFHKTMLFYFPLLIINYENLNIKRIAKIGAALVLALCGAAFIIGSRFERLAGLLTNILYDGKTSIYLNTSTRYGFITYFAVHLFTVFTIYQSKKLFCIYENRDPDTVKLLNFCYIVDLYVIICFPMVMISTVMNRLFRNVMVFNLISLGAVFNNFEKNMVSKRYYRFLSVVLLYAALWRILYVFDIPEAVNQIMTNNLLFN